MAVSHEALQKVTCQYSILRQNRRQIRGDVSIETFAGAVENRLVRRTDIDAFRRRCVQNPEHGADVLCHGAKHGIALPQQFFCLAAFGNVTGNFCETKEFTIVNSRNHDLSPKG
jgi:hypothetical protein